MGGVGREALKPPAYGWAFCGRGRSDGPTAPGRPAPALAVGTLAVSGQIPACPDSVSPVTATGVHHDRASVLRASPLSFLKVLFRGLREGEEALICGSTSASAHRLLIVCALIGD